LINQYQKSLKVWLLRPILASSNQTNLFHNLFLLFQDLKGAGGNYDQLAAAAAAAALNGMPPSFLSYLNPLAAAAAAAAATSSSPSPSPNTTSLSQQPFGPGATGAGSAASLLPPGLMSSLMDPLMSKSAQAQLMAAASAQQQNFMMQSSEMKSDSGDN
jgi:hypothetical protein